MRFRALDAKARAKLIHVPGEPVTRARILAVALSLAVAVAGGACSSDDQRRAGRAVGCRRHRGARGARRRGDHPVLRDPRDRARRPRPATSMRCAPSPSAAALDAARERGASVADGLARPPAPAGVGPAMDRRLAAAVGFVARPADDRRAAGRHRPCRRRRARRAGRRRSRGSRRSRSASSARGPTPWPTGRSSPLRVPGLGDRSSPLRQSAEVLDDWTDGYRDTFVAGMDGDPQSSVDAIVNEVIFRVTESTTRACARSWRRPASTSCRRRAPTDRPAFRARRAAGHPRRGDGAARRRGRGRTSPRAGRRGSLTPRERLARRRRRRRRGDGRRSPTR